jgi:hypothetical protein
MIGEVMNPFLPDLANKKAPRFPSGRLVEFAVQLTLTGWSRRGRWLVGGRLLRRQHADEAPVLALVLEEDHAVNEGVSSLPRPTFRPGLCRVPRWRIKIVPAWTSWPPKRFTPSRCPCESRPFTDEPPPFLCAMKNSPEIPEIL